VDDFQRFANACFAQGAQAVNKGAADVDAARTQGTGLEHVLPAAHTAVHVNFNVLAHGFNNAGQGADAAFSAIELAAAVVGDDQRVGSCVDGVACIFRVLDSLEDQFTSPKLLDPFHIVPVQRRVKLLGGPLR